MNNRFGFRDLVLCVLLLAILVSIWLTMKQRDQHWDQLRAIRTDLRGLSNTQNRMASQIAELQRAVARGIAVNPHTAAANGESPASDAGLDPERNSFTRLLQAHEQPDFAEGDVIVDAFGTQIKSVTALTYKDLYGRRIQNYVLEGLVEQDPDTLEWLPHIAESWTIDDHSEAYDAYMASKTAALTAAAEADPSLIEAMRDQLIAEVVRAGAAAPQAGTPEFDALTEQARASWMQQRIREDKDRPHAMTITFKLRPHVNFSDGNPLTAHDFVYAWTLLNNPLLNAPETRNFYDNVESYKALDDFTLEFRFREPHYLAFSMVAGFSALPKHFYERFSVDDLNRRPGLLMGSGPYRLEDPEMWAPGRLMKLVRNENYWGPRPAAEALVWLEIENDVARLTAFKNGQIDVFGAQPDQYVQLKEDAAIRAKYHAHEYMAIPSGYSFVAWNTQRGGRPTLFADKRVRLAMTLLIDRERIAQEVMLGLADPTSGPFDDASNQSDPEIRPHPFDPSRALSLLAECGWNPAPDGVIRNDQGQPLAFTLTYPSGNDIYERMMLLIKDNLNRYGVLMTQDPQEWSVFIERVDGRAFDACALAWGGGAIEGDIRQMFHSSQIAGGANNFTSYRNAELDRLIDDARRTIDEDERMKLWQACHRILHEDQPYTFMLRRKSTIFIDKRFHNVQKVKTGLNGRTEWYVPTPMQLRQP
jgi:peptide/nickel transport system substrate-binding protein